MPARRHAPGRGPSKWHITVTSADNERQILNAEADKDEIEALAAEARSHSGELKIWIRPPAGRVYSWD